MSSDHKQDRDTISRDRSSKRSTALVDHAWFFGLVAAIYSALALLFQYLPEASTPFKIFIFFAVGWLQYVLVQAMHEACHFYFLRNNPLSLFTAVLCTFPIGFTRNYKFIHFDHHRFFGDPERDPDYPAYLQTPKTVGGFLVKIVKIVTGYEVFLQILRQYLGLDAETKKSISVKNGYKFDLVYLALTQAFIFSLFLFLLHFPWYYYLLFWFLPIVIVVKMLSFLRLLAEHAPLEHQQIGLRNFDHKNPASYILGPYGFESHGLHHKKANIKFNRLQLHRTQAVDKVEVEYVNGSHFKVLFIIFRQLKWKL